MATLKATIMNTDGTTPLDKSYTIDDSMIPQLIAAYAAIYTPPKNKDGTPGTPYTPAQICEKWFDGVIEGSVAYINNFVAEQAKQAALAKVSPITVKSA